MMWLIPIMGRSGKPEGNGVTWAEKSGFVIIKEEKPQETIVKLQY